MSLNNLGRGRERKRLRGTRGDEDVSATVLGLAFCFTIIFHILHKEIRLLITSFRFLFLFRFSFHTIWLIVALTPALEFLMEESVRLSFHVTLKIELLSVNDEVAFVNSAKALARLYTGGSKENKTTHTKNI